jgi:hypothetical protein
MRTGVSYMGHHNPRHLRTDMEEMRELGCDDVFLALQENDFVHFDGKVRFSPDVARNVGLRPCAIFWGALNLFGGGKSSQFLLDHPEGFQVNIDGSHRPAGCYVNPICIDRIEQMIDTIADAGYEGYFVDEPTRLTDCFCPSCRRRFREWFAGDLAAASDEEQRAFRTKCVIEYVRTISDYVKASHPQIETQCCLMPHDRDMWKEAAAVGNLDNLGTDIYWVNDDRDVEEMRPLVQELADVCRRTNKIHHEWIQAFCVSSGKEDRLAAQGEILIDMNPDGLYAWAYLGQIGTTETCRNPEATWEAVKGVFRKAKGLA